MSLESSSRSNISLDPMLNVRLMLIELKAHPDYKDEVESAPIEKKRIVLRWELSSK